VVSGMGYLANGCLGVFNIATPPESRRRGYGAAMTVRVLQDAAAHGCTWAWLQASPDGYPIYERLGFRTLESWYSWVAPPS
jgi:N-acetylglutamate synthase